MSAFWETTESPTARKTPHRYWLYLGGIDSEIGVPDLHLGLDLDIPTLDAPKGFRREGGGGGGWYDVAPRRLFWLCFVVTASLHDSGGGDCLCRKKKSSIAVVRRVFVFFFEVSVKTSVYVQTERVATASILCCCSCCLKGFYRDKASVGHKRDRGISLLAFGFSEISSDKRSFSRVYIASNTALRYTCFCVEGVQ